MNAQTLREVALAMLDAAEAEDPTAIVVTLTEKLADLDPRALVGAIDALVLVLGARAGCTARDLLDGLWRAAPADPVT